MSSDTIQIRLTQPPMYLMGAVVIASLLPLFAGAASDAVSRPRRAFAGLNVFEPHAALIAIDDDESDEDAVQLVEPEP
ncbi:MAG: hypothetical protein KUG77_15400, partial [Nannocystaceae bacterium]|nr:hypothetical protein [Nannocystaceae bacterium]